MSDLELLTLIEESPEEGMEQLLKEYHSLLWFVCSQKLQNEEDIKEVVNDVFAYFYNHREAFDVKKGSLKNYLCLLANRRSIEKYRSISSLKEVMLESEIPDQEPDLLWKITLEEAIKKLTEEDAQIIRMKYYEGMSYQEIAEALDISYETAKKRGQRNVSKLKKWIIIIIILAVLVGCAIAIHYFQFSKKSGLNFDLENPIYEIETDETNTIMLEDIRVNVQQMVYYGDSLNIMLSFEPTVDEEQHIASLKNLQRTTTMYINDREVGLDTIEMMNYSGSYLYNETIDFSLEELSKPIIVSFRNKDTKEEVTSLQFTMNRLNEQDSDITSFGQLITYPEGSFLIQSAQKKNGWFIELFPALNSKYKLSQELLVEMKQNPTSDLFYLLDTNGNRIYPTYVYSTSFRLGNSFRFFFETKEKDCTFVINDLLISSQEEIGIENKRFIKSELGPELEIQTITFHEEELKEDEFLYLKDLGISFDEIFQKYHQIELDYKINDTDPYSIEKISLMLDIYLEDGTVLKGTSFELLGKETHRIVDVGHEIDFSLEGEYIPPQWMEQKVDRVEIGVKKVIYRYKKTFEIPL